MNISVFSRFEGAGSATTRKIRGLTRSVIALIVPPLPAASRPSKVYEKELHKLQVELCRLQDWVKETGERIIILFLVSSWPLLSCAFVGTCC